MSTTSVQALQTRVRELNREVRRLETHLKDIRAWTARASGLSEEQLLWRLKCIQTCLDDPDRPERDHG